MTKTLKNSAASEVIAKLYLNDELADVRFVFNVNEDGYNKEENVDENDNKIILEDTIFVSGMSPQTTVQDIVFRFCRVGAIKADKRRLNKPKIWLYRNKETGKSKGEATITYDDSNAAKLAISEFNSTDFMGATIDVSYAYRKINAGNSDCVYDCDDNMTIVENMIFVNGMNPQTTVKDIEMYFGKIGDIQMDNKTKKPNIWLFTDKETGQSTGKATITYKSRKSAKTAISKCHNREFNGAQIFVSFYSRRRYNCQHMDNHHNNCGEDGAAGSDESSSNDGSDDAVDASFNGNGLKVSANKAILAALSPVFYSMFFGALKEGNEVRIVDADPDSFKEFLQFFYLTEVTISMENIETVIRLADKYDILGYIHSCTLSLESELTLNNICWGFQFALYLKRETLIQFCERAIAKFSRAILSTGAFLQCDKFTLKKILEMRLLCSKMDILNGCLDWAKYACRQIDLDENQPENLRKQLDDCLHLLPFRTMKMTEFVEFAKSNDGFFTSEEFKDYIFSLASEEDN